MKIAAKSQVKAEITLVLFLRWTRIYSLPNEVIQLFLLQLSFLLTRKKDETEDGLNQLWDEGQEST